MQNRLSVICWILTKTEKTKQDNRIEDKLPSESWARAKYYGEIFNNSLRNHIVEVLRMKGFFAVAPVLSGHWRWGEDSIHGYTSNWSERHTAYVCGLGTFGLCEGLITPFGKAVRIGSLVTNANLIPTERKYDNYRDYCLYFKTGKCLKCVKRCPAGAITPKGHDKRLCRNYIKNLQLIIPKSIILISVNMLVDYARQMFHASLIFH